MQQARLVGQDVGAVKPIISLEINFLPSWFLYKLIFNI